MQRARWLLRRGVGKGGIAIRVRLMLVGAGTAAAMLAALMLATGAAARTSSGLGWGTNAHGQLGQGWVGDEATEPVGLVDVSSGIKQLAGAGALLTSGEFVSWGSTGQLQHVETNVETKSGEKWASPVEQVAGNDGHRIYLLENGRVETNGSNIFGELGNGTEGTEKENCEEGGLGEPGKITVCASAAPVPVETGYSLSAEGQATSVGALNNVSYVFSDGANDGVIKEGKVFTWGENREEQVCDGHEKYERELEGGTIEKVERGEAADVPIEVPGVSEAASAAFGAGTTQGGHLLILLKDHKVLGCGGDEDAQLCLGHDTATKTRTLEPTELPLLGSEVSQVEGSFEDSFAITSKGELLGCGADTEGQLGIKATEDCFKRDYLCIESPTKILADVTQISSQFNYSAAIAEGKVYTFGINAGGRLGNGLTGASDGICKDKKTEREEKECEEIENTENNLEPKEVKGASDVTEVQALEDAVLGTTSGTPPSPIPGRLALSPGTVSGTSALIVEWEWPHEHEGQWLVSYRRAGTEEAFTKTNFSCESERHPPCRDTIASLAPETEYEVALSERHAGTPSFTRRRILGTSGPA